MSNQEKRQQSVRAVTGTAYFYEDDWHALFDQDGIADGVFNDRLLLWINSQLSTSYQFLGDAMQAFAVDQGYINWSSMGDFALGSADPSFEDLLATENFDYFSSPRASVKTWYDAGYPTVRVEKGYGSGILQNLYWDQGYLWTSRFGGGVRADVWAGSDRLFVEIPYNQFALDLLPTSHPAALSADKRVLLNLSTPTSPFFAGYSTGTQDPSQHATQRGYALPAGLTHVSRDYFTMIALHAWAASEIHNPIQDTTTGLVRNWELDGSGNRRHFASWDIGVSNFGATAVPQLLMHTVTNEAGLAITASHAYQGRTWGVTGGNGESAGNATSFALNIMGPTNSLRGKLWALGIKKSAFTTRSNMLVTGIPRKLAALSAPSLATDQFEIAFPLNNQVIPMNLITQVADIPIRLFGKPNTEYQASWSGGAYASIGTSDANGYLAGALLAQAKGNGTLNVREGVSGTPRSRTDVAVGYFLVVMGESEPAGRNDNVTITVPTNFYRLDRVNRFAQNASENFYWKLLVQKIYDTYNCVVGVTLNALGSTFLVPVATEAHWDPYSARASIPNNYQQGFRFLERNQLEILTPNLFYWDVGKNDAAQASSESAFAAKFPEILTGYRALNSNFNFGLIMSGANGAVLDSRTDAIRRAQATLGYSTSGFTFLGSFAHLPTTEAGQVHFQTQAEKQAAIDVVWRHLNGAGSAPRYSSASRSGADLIITFTGGVSPLTRASAPSDLLGWAVSDGNGTRTVNSIAVSGLQATLTCDQTLSGTVTFSFCSGETGIGTTIRDSAATTPLPPVPFNASI
jgi:hypothetical protein